MQIRVIVAAPSATTALTSRQTDQRASSILRTMAKDGKSVKELRARKDEMLSDIYTLLVYAYGQPPKEFSFRYKKEKDSKSRKISPRFAGGKQSSNPLLPKRMIR